MQPASIESAPDAAVEEEVTSHRDCVREYPSCSPDHVLLVTFDWRGIARYKDEIPAEEDIQRWSRFLLRRCREKFPRPLQLVD